MAEQRATATASTADEAHDDAQERRARRETRAHDRERSGEYVEGMRDQRRHEKSKSTRRARPGAKSARKAGANVQRSAVAPVSTAAFSAAGLFGVALSLVALYLVLTSAETVAQVVKLMRHGLSWLASPHKSIPYGKES